MSPAPVVGLAGRQSAVVLFTLTFPFGRGEEFLESEIPHLLGVFDRVVVVPTLRTEDMAQNRSLPPGAEVVAAGTRSAARVARFLASNPGAALRAIARAVASGPRVDRMIADAKFDAYAVAMAHRVAPHIADHLGGVADVVFYAYWLHVPARVALEVRRRLGRATSPAVSRANGFDLYLERHASGHLPQRKLLLRGLTMVFAASAPAEQYLREHYDEHAAKFTSDRIGTPAAINAGNASRHALHVVSCSYIAPVKRLTMLIDDLAEAQRRIAPGLRWTHIGSGEDGYVEEVEAHAANMLPPDSFEFLGHMENRALRRWYAEHPATVFVQVSESEGGLAASIQEALAQGLPVIATDVGGVGALRQDPELFPGLLERDHSPAQFARRLEELLTAADEEYGRYAAASMAFWQTHCSADRLASAFAQRLRGIADAPAGVAAGVDPSR